MADTDTQTSLWKLREELFCRAQGRVEARQRFEEHEGRKSTKPLTIDVDARDLLRLLDALSDAQEAITRTTDLATIWKARAEHDIEYARLHVPHGVRDRLIDNAQEDLNRARQLVRAINGEPQTEEE